MSTQRYVLMLGNEPNFATYSLVNVFQKIQLYCECHEHEVEFSIRDSTLTLLSKWMFNINGDMGLMWVDPAHLREDLEHFPQYRKHFLGLTLKQRKGDLRTFDPIW